MTRKNTGDYAAKSSSGTAGDAKSVEKWRHCKFITFNFEANWEVTLRRISLPFVRRAIDEPIGKDCDTVNAAAGVALRQ